jgi:O-antigen/teichoic acid export membrane protein
MRHAFSSRRSGLYRIMVAPLASTIVVVHAHFPIGFPTAYSRFNRKALEPTLIRPRMNRLRQNIIASFVSKSLSALLSLICVPLYVKFLGVEAYGVIGVFVTLQAALALLDLGLGAAFTREVAKISHRISASANTRDLLRTLEFIYWGMALVMGIVIWALGPLIANHWLRLGTLPPAEVGRSIGIAGLSFAFFWPTSLYIGGLTGLQKQVMLAWITTIAAIVRVGGTLLALRFTLPTLDTFFLAQALANLFQTACVGFFLWRSLASSGSRPVFKPALVRVLARFAGGITGISITAVLLTQLDKLILSKTLPLESFGYYAISGTLASGLYIFISPLFGVLFPRFSQLVAEGDRPSLLKLYHTGCQLMSVLVLPAAAVLAVFSPGVALVLDPRCQNCRQRGNDTVPHEHWKCHERIVKCSVCCAACSRMDEPRVLH